MEQSRVLDEQARVMDKYTALGAHCFVLATFDELRAYRIPWLHWKNMKARWGRKYVTEADLSEYRLSFGSGFTPALTKGIPTPNSIAPGATLEDILTAYCGLPYGAEPDGEEWNRAYNLLIDLFYALEPLTGQSFECIVDMIDRIGAQNGEV